MLSTLPLSSFVRFDAQRLANPRLLWVRDRTTANKYLEGCSYCCPLPGELEAAYLNESRSMLAERYGGSGIGVNGGGVRCGWLEGHQIKGVGRTALAGVGAPYWHSYGGASASSAVREAIWGEVFDSALPFGAVTVHAIIATGSTVRLGSPDHLGNTTSQRALVVRPPFLRPAHYLRATLFRPASGFLDAHPGDVERTRSAVRSMRVGLAGALGCNQGDPLSDLLGVAYRRYATQIAAARAKRLVHGSLSASNIALDGRLLDFGGASSVSDHGRIIVAPGCTDAWQQHAGLLGSIDDLVYHIDKYSDESIDRVALCNSLRSVFLGTLEQRFAIEILKLSGVPETALATLPNAEVAHAASAFREVLEAGNREPFKLFGPCAESSPQMPQRMGHYHLGECIKRAVVCETPESADSALAADLPDPQLRQRFVATNWWLRTVYLNGRGDLSACKAMDFVHFNAHRLNAPLDALYSYALRQRIDATLAAGEEVGDFISRTVTAVADLVREPVEGEVRLCIEGIAPILASPAKGLRLGGAEINWSAMRSRAPGLFESAHGLPASSS